MKYILQGECMKKILTAVSLISLAAVCSFAADVKAELQEQISKTLATSAPAIPNQGASAQNLSVFFKIYKGIPIFSKSVPPYKFFTIKIRNFFKI